jgi:hypothetical protein
MMNSNQPESGDMLTLGDCGFPVTFTWIHALTPVLGLDIEIPKAVGKYHQRIAHHPAIFEELEAYRPQLSAWLKIE